MRKNRERCERRRASNMRVKRGKERECEDERRGKVERGEKKGERRWNKKERGRK